MKIRFRLVTLFMCAIMLLLSACAVPSENPPAAPTDTSPETYMSEPPENSLYTIERGEGSIHLIVNDEELISAWKQYAADKEAETQSDVIYRSVMEIPIAEPVSFPTVEILKDRVLNYKLTEDELRRLYLLHRDQQDRIVLYDLYTLTDPSLPTGISNVQVNCAPDFSIYFSLPLDRDGSYLILNADTYAELSREYDGPPSYASVQETYVEEERNATVYDYVTAAKGLYRQMSYTVVKNGIEYKIVEKYNISVEFTSYPVSETVPYAVDVYYESGGQYYLIAIFFPAERPSVEWLTSFGVAHME